MSTKTRIILAAALVLGSVSSVLADSYDYNPQDRWPDAKTTAQPAGATNGHRHLAALAQAEKAQFDRASRVTDGGF